MSIQRIRMVRGPRQGDGACQSPLRRPHLVDLWCFFYERETGANHLDALMDLLSIDERERHDRLCFARDRLMFVATRALVRTVLSEYADIAPREWRFGQGEHGKPVIAGPSGAPELSFNLTNTRGLVACAVSTTSSQVGVDAESIDRPGDLVSVAEANFSSIEVAALLSLPAAARKARFFQYWTLKESYVKARGLGLSLPLDRFSFLLDEGAIRVTFDPLLDDAPERWSFAQPSASPRHVVAISAATFGAPLAVRSHRYIPLVGELPLDPRSNGAPDTDAPPVPLVAT